MDPPPPLTSNLTWTFRPQSRVSSDSSPQPCISNPQISTHQHPFRPPATCLDTPAPLFDTLTSVSTPVTRFEPTAPPFRQHPLLTPHFEPPAPSNSVLSPQHPLAFQFKPPPPPTPTSEPPAPPTPHFEPPPPTNTPFRASSTQMQATSSTNTPFRGPSTSFRATSTHQRPDSSHQHHQHPVSGPHHPLTPRFEPPAPTSTLFRASCTHQHPNASHQLHQHPVSSPQHLISGHQHPPALRFEPPAPLPRLRPTGPHCESPGPPFYHQHFRNARTSNRTCVSTFIVIVYHPRRVYEQSYTVFIFYFHFFKLLFHPKHVYEP